MSLSQHLLGEEEKEWDLHFNREKESLLKAKKLCQMREGGLIQRKNDEWLQRFCARPHHGWEHHATSQLLVASPGKLILMSCGMKKEMGLQPELLVGGHPSKTAIEKTAAFKRMKKRAVDICRICSDGGFEREQRPRRPPSSHFGKSGPQLCTSGCSSHLKIFFSRTWRFF